MTQAAMNSNEAASRRAREIRDAPFPEAPGWIAGVRADTIYSLKWSDNATHIIISFAQQGVEAVRYVPVEWDRSPDPEENTKRLIAARNTLALQIMLEVNKAL